MDNYGYKEGTDNEFAPWNQEPSGKVYVRPSEEERARLNREYDAVIAHIESVFGK